MELRTRIEGAVFGLTYGEGIAIPSAQHRLGILAPKRISRIKSLGEFAEEKKQTSRPSPYTHSQPGSMLNPLPADDTEWFAFVVDYLIKGRNGDEVWLDLANRFDQIKARTGTKIALKNLLNGQKRPQSGHDNPHYFDDISLVRAIAISLVLFKDAHSLNQALITDISTTHSEDGLYCAIAVSRLFASILHGEDKETAFKAALYSLPTESWSRFQVDRALKVAANNRNTLQRSMDLEYHFVENVYAYPVSAPETLALLLAHFTNTNTPEELVSASMLHKRKLDSLPALAGALSGVFYGKDWIPTQNLSDELALDGVCIPELKGLKLRQLIEQICQNL